MSSWSWISTAKPASRMCSIQATQQPQLGLLCTTSSEESAVCAGATGLCAGTDGGATGAAEVLLSAVQAASTPTRPASTTAKLLLMSFIANILHVTVSKPESEADNSACVAA